MHGGQARRYCDVCEKHVTNLSELSESQAGRFLLEHAGRSVCVRYRSAPDGTIRFRTPSVAAPLPRVLEALRPGLAAAGLAALLLSGCTGERVPSRVDADACTYEVGPFSFQVARGQGSCPPEDDGMLVMGAVAPPVVPDQIQQMGNTGIADPPDVMGEAPIVQERELMGDIAAPEPPPPPAPPAPEPELMGKVVAVP
jgi:hypothetical protein